MNTKLAVTCLMIGTMLAPIVSYAAGADSDSDRKNPTTFVKDSAITTKIKAKLAEEHMTSLGNIHVDTDANGNVVLSGTARTQADIDKAVSIARGTEHVVSVKNKLTIKKDD